MRTAHAWGVTLHRSLWLREALALERPESRPLEGDRRADVCIVGGGYTGLWTAIRLRELAPSLEVLVLEADICGGGASGRNGGFVLNWWAKFGSLLKICGAGEAVRLGLAAAHAVEEIGEFCRRNGIDAHFRRDGWLWAATSAAQIGAWTGTLKALEEHGLRPLVELSAEETARLAGSGTHLAGVLDPDAATVQPALLARGLRRVALERGVQVFEGSPMVGLDRERQLRVVTPRGSVTARRVVLALNAWSVRLAELRRALAVVGSDIVASEPVPGHLARLGWTNGLAISDSRMLVNYYRTTLDGRIAFGTGGGVLGFGGRVGRRFEGPSPRRADVEANLRTLYPELGDVRVATSWTGPVARTTTGLPCFGRLAGCPAIVYGFGYSGNGVGPSYLGGKILASLALDLDDEWSATPLARGPHGRFPPEPLRYLGGRVVRAAIARKERAEDRGRRPGRLTSVLAALAPGGLVPVKPS